GNPLKFIVAIAGDIDALAIRAETDRRVSNFRPAFGSNEVLLAPAGIDKPEITLVYGHFFDCQERVVIRRPVGNLPTAALILRQQTVGGLVGRVHDIEIEIRAVASRRGVGHDVASVRPDVADIARLAVGEQPDVPGTALVAIELKPLSTADVFAEDKITAAVGMVRSTRDAIGEEGQLGPRPA